MSSATARAAVSAKTPARGTGVCTVAECVHVGEAGRKVAAIDGDPAVGPANRQAGRLDDGGCPVYRNADEQVISNVSRAQPGQVRGRLERLDPSPREIADVSLRPRLNDGLRGLRGYRNR